MNPVRQNVKFDKKLIDKDALKVVKTLVKNGYEAYLVGGCIRDLLLGLQPKDFDIATSATPEQIHKVFKRSRIIGRRFKLVHIMFSSRKYIEVATFRAGKVKTSNKGQVIRDNFYGSLKDDVFRRDFTVNALYYDVDENNLIDFYNGLKDIKKNQLRIIGNPKDRFKEDPIRILRGVRFAAKLKMEIHKETFNEIKNSLNLLKFVPYSRLFDEVMKLFITGHAQESMVLFKQFQLSNIYFPTLENNNKLFNDFLLQALKNTDLRILDKISSKNTLLKIKNGELTTYKDLSIKSLKCKNSEFDDNPEITAYLQVKDLKSSDNDEVFVFNGWTFSSSPTLRPFDHPVYDIWITKCY